MNKTEQPGLRINQVLLEHAEFSHRDDFLSFPKETRVELNLEYSFHSGISPDGNHAVARVEVRTQDASQLYVLAFRMAAFLEAEVSPPNFPLPDYLALNTWVMLFPFLREAVASVSGRGRFGPILLNPINIPAMVGPQQREAPKPITSATSDQR